MYVCMLMVPMHIYVNATGAFPMVYGYEKQESQTVSFTHQNELTLIFILDFVYDMYVK